MPPGGARPSNRVVTSRMPAFTHSSADAARQPNTKTVEQTPSAPPKQRSKPLSGMVTARALGRHLRVNHAYRTTHLRSDR